MNEIMPSLPVFMAFLMASLILAVTPGPGVLYIVTRSLQQGRLPGIVSVLGVAVGNLGNAIGAAVGLAALFAMSQMAFLVVKYLGAIYLLYLGIKTLQEARFHQKEKALALTSSNLSKIFLDGLIVALLNPKTTLFFAAFLPQFLNSSQATLPQTLFLSAVFVLLAAVTDMMYAILAHLVSPLLKGRANSGRVGKYISGSVFIGLGLIAAFTGQRHTAK